MTTKTPSVFQENFCYHRFWQSQRRAEQWRGHFTTVCPAGAVIEGLDISAEDAENTVEAITSEGDRLFSHQVTQRLRQILTVGLKRFCGGTAGLTFWLIM